VAKDAGVSAGIIYHYFDSKDSLVDELYKTIKHQFIREMFAGFDQSEPLSSQLRQLIKNALKLYIQYPQKVIFIEQYARSPYNRPEIQAEVRQYYQPLIDCMEQARQQKLIKDLPEAVIYTLTMEVARNLALQHATGIIVMDEILIEKVTDACWEAIRR